MNRYYIIGAGLVLVFAASYAASYLLSLPNAEPTLSPTISVTAGGERTVSLYFYNPEKDKDAAGNVLCSRQGLTPVRRTIPLSTTPIQDTIRLLLQGGLTGQERAAGITTEYPLAGVALKGASLREGVLTLAFDDPQNSTGGGSCRVAILWAQISATAEQFPEVRSVRFSPDYLFQP